MTFAYLDTVKGQYSHIAVPIDDGVTFQVKNISEIMDEAEYPARRPKWIKTSASI